jgi:hypothetical protein
MERATWSRLASTAALIAAATVPGAALRASILPILDATAAGRLGADAQSAIDPPERQDRPLDDNSACTIQGRACDSARCLWPKFPHCRFNLFQTRHLEIHFNGHGHFFLLPEPRCGPIWPIMKTRRRHITLSEPLERFLEQEAARLGVTVSELIRRILDQYREQKE